MLSGRARWVPRRRGQRRAIWAVRQRRADVGSPNLGRRSRIRGRLGCARLARSGSGPV